MPMPFSPTRLACGVLTVKTGYRLREGERAVPPSCRDRFPKDPGTKILVPKKNGEPERRSLSVCRGARGAAGPPPGGLGGWKPPQEEQGVWGAAAPVKTILWIQDMIFLFDQDQDFGTRI